MSEPETVGGQLQAARQRRRISTQKASDDTRIRSSFLQKMEEDDFDFLAPAYVRGFLRSYATYLGLDAVPLLTEFDEQHGVDRVPTQELLDLDRQKKGSKSPKPPKSPGLKSMGASAGSMTRSARISNWTVAAIIALIAIIALSVVGILNPNKNETSSNTASGNRGKSRVATAPTPSETATASPSGSPTQTPSGQTLAQTGLKVTVDATNGACWTLVVADGQPAGQLTLAAGQSRTFSADHKMYIRLGNAGAVQVTVNGQTLGPIGSQGAVVNLNLPQDIHRYL